MDNVTILRLASIIAVLLIMLMAMSLAVQNDAKVILKFLDGLTRQPEAHNVLFTSTLVSVGLVESMAIIGTVVALILIFANPLVGA